jgi:NADH-quinone oxidoreductase subunit C
MLNNYITITLKKLLSHFISSISLDYYPLVTLRSHSLISLPLIFTLLKTSSVFRLNTLVELTAYDIPNRASRFTLNFFLLSVEYNYRLGININLEQTTFVPTLFSIYPNSSWSEREIRDMFGIYFINNPDLRRLLTDYGFEGFPLRKDFPLTGYFEVRYDDEVQQILYEPVQLSQEFRVFSLSSP